MGSKVYDTVDVMAQTDVTGCSISSLIVLNDPYKANTNGRMLHTSTRSERWGG